VCDFVQEVEVADNHLSMMMPSCPSILDLSMEKRRLEVLALEVESMLVPAPDPPLHFLTAEEAVQSSEAGRPLLGSPSPLEIAAGDEEAGRLALRISPCVAIGLWVDWMELGEGPEGQGGNPWGPKWPFSPVEEDGAESRKPRLWSQILVRL
jgi:hypothetical protein